MTRKRWDAILDRIPTDQRVIGVEVGVWKGKLSTKLLMARRNLTLYLVDPWKCAEPGTSFAESGAEMAEYSQAEFDEAKALTLRQIEQFGRRAKVLEMDSVSAAIELARRRVNPDFVFIDGDHSYEGCKADIEAWQCVLEKGALFISGHDYANRRGEVKRAVDEAFGVERVETDDDHCWFVRPE